MKPRKKKRIRQHLTAALLAACIALTGCKAMVGEIPANVAENQEAPTLKILLLGSSFGLDRTLEQLYSQMDETHRWKLQISFYGDSTDYAQQLGSVLNAHEDYDLVFDAPWLTLSQQAERRSYKKLDGYFNNADYPALQACFPSDYLEANKVSGSLYAIPFTNTYYDPLGIFYRKDLLEDLNLGFDTITSRAQLLAFWQAVQETEKYEPISLGSRGFFLLNLPEITLRQAGVWDVPGWSFWDYPAKVVLSADGKTVQDVVFLGDEAARYENFAAPYNTNFLDDYLLENADCFCYTSSTNLLCVNGNTAFLAGTAASFESSLGSGGSAQVQQRLLQQVPGGKVAFYSYDAAFDAENRTTGAIPVTYSAWNYLCVPAYSDDPDTAMSFLNWLFSDTARLDLFNYGVEGEDWQAVGEDEYTLCENPAGVFSFPAYELTWNPSHYRIDATLEDNEKELMSYIYDADSFTDSPFENFSISIRKIEVEYARLNAIYADYYPAFCHGAYGGDTAEKIAEMHAKSEEAGLETVRAELICQLQAFLDEKG